MLREYRITNDFKPPSLNDNGVGVLSLWASFHTDTQIWDEFRRIGAKIDETNDGWWAEFYGLSETWGAGQPYVWVSAHTHEREEDRAHWLVVRDRMPRDEPPDLVRESSERVGGYAALARLMEALADEGRKPLDEVGVQAAFFLDAARWPAPLDGAMSHPDIVRGEDRLVLTKQHWELNDGRERGFEIVTSVVPGELGLVVQAKADYPLTFSATFLQSAEAAIWQDTSPWMTSRT